MWYITPVALNKSISVVRGSECSEVMNPSIASQSAWLATALIKTFVKECKGWFSRWSDQFVKACFFNLENVQIDRALGGEDH